MGIDFILENNIVVSGNSSQSKIGVDLSSPKDSTQSINRNIDSDVILISKGIGQRVAEMAHIIRVGLKHYQESLGLKYCDKKYQRFI